MPVPVDHPRAVFAWHDNPMTPTAAPSLPATPARVFLAALVAIGLLIGITTTASATTTPTAQNVVGAHALAAGPLVGPGAGVFPATRPETTLPHAKTVVATGVAANTAADVPTVVFSRSRAPGIAQNFDDAVANGAPTQLNRVSGAVRDANLRAALRGQAPAPAGQSLDEFPFACSAQGGVLSRFFQDRGIGVGDPLNVTVGP